MDDETLKIGLVSISDRASAGVYQDQGIPALSEFRFGFTNGDHHLRQLTLMPNGSNFEAAMADVGGEDPWYIEGRWYRIPEAQGGVVTAVVPGENADHYKFTSALPVTVLKLMAPELTGHLKPEQDTPMALPLS